MITVRIPLTLAQALKAKRDPLSRRIAEGLSKEKRAGWGPELQLDDAECEKLMEIASVMRSKEDAPIKERSAANSILAQIRDGISKQQRGRGTSQTGRGAMGPDQPLASLSDLEAVVVSSSEPRGGVEPIAPYLQEKVSMSPKAAEPEPPSAPPAPAPIKQAAPKGARQANGPASTIDSLLMKAAVLRTVLSGEPGTSGAAKVVEEMIEELRSLKLPKG